jgi:GTPase SAR1 family protein
LFDTAGVERYNVLPKAYYNHSDGIIVAFDLTDRLSFNKIDSFIQQMESHIDPNDVVKTLVGTKCDLENERQVTEQEAKEKAESLKYEYFETSSVSGRGITDLFSTMANKIDELIDKKEAQANFQSNFEKGPNLKTEHSSSITSSFRGTTLVYNLNLEE